MGICSWLVFKYLRFRLPISPKRNADVAGFIVLRLDAMMLNGGFPKSSILGIFH